MFETKSHTNAVATEEHIVTTLRQKTNNTASVMKIQKETMSELLWPEN